MELFIGVRALLRPAVPIDSFRNSTPFLVCWRSGEETCDFFEEFRGFRASFSSNYSLAVVGFQWRLPTDCNCFLPCGYRGVSGSVLETLLERVPSVFYINLLLTLKIMDIMVHGTCFQVELLTNDRKLPIAGRRCLPGLVLVVVLVADRTVDAASAKVSRPPSIIVFLCQSISTLDWFYWVLRRRHIISPGTFGNSTLFSDFI